MTMRNLEKSRRELNLKIMIEDENNFFEGCHGEMFHVSADISDLSQVDTTSSSDLLHRNYTKLSIDFPFCI